MAYIKEYWNNKWKRAKDAKAHTEQMTVKYNELIQDSINDTKVYHMDSFQEKDLESSISKETVIMIEDMDSVSAIMKYGGPKAVVLNFSSYKEPGGMFINGSKAQEECLCHESFLYNVLVQNKDFYEWNNQHKNKALYLNRALYSPKILFMSDSDTETTRFCNVITCAAPNKSAAQKYQNVSDKENTDALKSRIHFILDIARDNQVDTLILGAYGCGVFGQDAKEVAEIFKEFLSTEFKCFERVIFAIPKSDNGNYTVFQNVFSH